MRSSISRSPSASFPSMISSRRSSTTRSRAGLRRRMEEYSRNWSGIAAYAIAGLELALFDLKGKALGVPVAELLGGLCRERVPVVGYLFIDEPEENARKAAEFVAAGHTELKLKVGRSLAQDYDTLAAIRDAVGSDAKIRIDANMSWSV